MLGWPGDGDWFLVHVKRHKSSGYTSPSLSIQCTCVSVKLGRYFQLVSTHPQCTENPSDDRQKQQQWNSVGERRGSSLGDLWSLYHFNPFFPPSIKYNKRIRPSAKVHAIKDVVRTETTASYDIINIHYYWHSKQGKDTYTQNMYSWLFPS